jgi:GH35 family endo-1,4-beta-xylanase
MVRLRHRALSPAARSASSSPPAWRQRRCSAAILRIQLAEAESSLGLIPGNRVEELAGQREVYHDMVALCRTIPSCDVNFFGFTDAYYWITFLNRDPLMFDPHYLAKPAFFGVRDALVGY